MAYRFNIKWNCDENLRRIAHEQLVKAYDDSTDETLSLGERIHKARTRCKKMISRMRDADALGECYDKLMDYFREEVDLPKMSPLGRKLTLRRNALAEESMDIL